MIAWRRRQGMPKPIDYVRGWLAAMIALVVLRSFAQTFIAVSFPHWDDWTVANAGDVVGGLLVQIGVAVPVVFVALRAFDLVRRVFTGLRSLV